MCLYVDGYAHNIIYMNGLKKNKICALCNIQLTVSLESLTCLSLNTALLPSRANQVPKVCVYHSLVFLC